MMHIGFVAHEVHAEGGMERAALELILRLRRDHHVSIMSERCDAQAANATWVPVSGILTSLVHDYTFAWSANLAERRLKPDITYSIGSAAVDADVVIAQFCYAAFTKECGGIRGGARPWRRAYQFAAQRMAATRERHIFSSPRVKRIVAVSQGVGRELVDHYNVDPERILVIPNGVDREVFKPTPTVMQKNELRRRLGLPESACIVLFVGGDWHRKGLPDVIRAVTPLREVVLVVVGRGNIAEFRGIASELHATDKVVFIPHTTRPQDYYAAADIFAFPSRYEAFSLATLEAAASGLPLLTLRINGTEELVSDGVNGYFVGASPQSIRERIEQLRDDAQLRYRLSLGALSSSERYGWNEIGNEHLRLVATLNK